MYWLPWVAGQLARYRGDAPGAWAAVRWLLPEGPASEPGDRFLGPALQVQQLAAALALDAGDLPAGRAWLAGRLAHEQTRLRELKGRHYTDSN